MNLLIAIIFLYSIPNIKGSHRLVFSESDILNIVKTLEDKIESQGKKIEMQGKMFESQEKRIKILEGNCELKILKGILRILRIGLMGRSQKYQNLTKI